MQHIPTDLEIVDLSKVVADRATNIHPRRSRIDLIHGCQHRFRRHILSRGNINWIDRLQYRPRILIRRARVRQVDLINRLQDIRIIRTALVGAIRRGIVHILSWSSPCRIRRGIRCKRQVTGTGSGAKTGVPQKSRHVCDQIDPSRRSRPTAVLRRTINAQQIAVVVRRIAIIHDRIVFVGHATKNVWHEGKRQQTQQQKSKPHLDPQQRISEVTLSWNRLGTLRKIAKKLFNLLQPPCWSSRLSGPDGSPAR